jgi:3-methyladenine DNA glycosylase AlkD
MTTTRRKPSATSTKSAATVASVAKRARAMKPASPSGAMSATSVLAWLEAHGTQRTIDGMARYGIEAKHAFGVTMAMLLSLAKRLGTDQALSLALWESNWYEARLLATLIGDPQQVTRRQMDGWAAGFENWGDCDTACFKLFDRSPHAWSRATAWAASRRELVRRGGFVLMACLALHDKTAADDRFLPLLPLIEEGARDERPLVAKGISWALRSIGRRNLALHAASIDVARRLSTSDQSPCRWVGKDALRELSSAKVRAQLARRAR